MILHRGYDNVEELEDQHVQYHRHRNREERVWKVSCVSEICSSNEGLAQALVHSVTPRSSLRQSDLLTEYA